MTARNGNDYDVAIVGASLAGCSAAMLFGRLGARVALIDKRPDPRSFKRVCSHLIQASAMPTIERLGLLEPMLDAGAQRTRIRIWTRWGWIEPPTRSLVEPGINLRRELLDPLVREHAANTDGVELILGHAAQELLRTDGEVRGVQVGSPQGATRRLNARLVVGADGRDSRVASLAGVRKYTIRHGRFAYGAYFEDSLPANAPDASAWFLDPEWVAAFPTDSGLTFYATMPLKRQLPEFRADPARALVQRVSELPDAPPIRASRMVGSMVGKLEMPNVSHVATAPGLALVGDAALAIDPIWGVGCGWAFQSAEWLADSLAPALSGAEPLDRGLKRYRRRHRRALIGHALAMYDYARGRRFSPAERMLFSAAVHDEKVARRFEAFGTRTIGPVRMLATTLPRAAVVNARYARRSRARTRARLAGAG